MRFKRFFDAVEVDVFKVAMTLASSIARPSSGHRNDRSVRNPSNIAFLRSDPAAL